MRKYCIKCGNPVQPEEDIYLIQEYPYYCEYCDENLYEMETVDEDEY